MVFSILKVCVNRASLALAAALLVGGCTHEQREQLQASWKERGRARVIVPVELLDASGAIVTTVSVTCILLPRQDV